MSKIDFQSLQEKLKETKKIVLTTHQNPDGDALGSLLGLYHFLHRRGFEVIPFVPDPYPEFLHWLPGNDQVKVGNRAPEVAKTAIAEADLIFSLDYNALHRAGILGEMIGSAQADKVMIDHHRQPEDYARFTMSDPEVCSTAQLIFDFIDQLGGKDEIDKDIAECIYTGLITDTGSFRFSSTTAHTHEVVAELLNKGLQHELVHQRIFDNQSLSRLRLVGYCLSEKLVVLPEYKTAFFYLSQEELRRFNFRKGDTEGVVNYGLSINGIIFSTMIIEKEDAVKLSFRSQGNFDVNTFARENFNGGGHFNAAGGISYDNLENTISKLKELLPKYKDSLLDEA